VADNDDTTSAPVEDHAEQPTVGEALQSLGEPRDSLTVRLSRELITLLSEQLYSSASKAIEELVVNSFDADAQNCWVVVPSASPGTDVAELPVIAVLDDGVGMDEAGLADLWRVGVSTKRDDVVERIRKRRQIGKFGIGKLATYALAARVTYVTCQGDGDIFTVSLSFNEFASDSSGEPEEPVTLEVRKLTTDEVLSLPVTAAVCHASGVSPVDTFASDRHWTLVLLEEFKPRAEKLSAGRLRWVLATAMPLADFALHLNGLLVPSSKAKAIENAVVDFSVTDLPQERLNRIEAKTSQKWSVVDVEVTPGTSEKALTAPILPQGIRGTVCVSSETIYGGKSSDLARSHGFFIRVRDRLISEDDPLFGVAPLSYEVFNRFRAELDVDDLDADITAPRESAGIGERVSAVQDVLTELFNEARTRYEAAERKRTTQETKREDQRQYVFPRFVEKPVADALLQSGGMQDGGGADADDDWFYLRRPSSDRVKEIAAEFYSVKSRDPYIFRLEDFGRDGRLVLFHPEERTFVVNADHELALAFKDNPSSQDLLFDVAVAEALLEVYLRESGMSAHLVGEVLERRDSLLRSLAREQVNSPAAIAALLQDAISSDRDLEIALVVAARALGFVAKHVGNADRADGVARFADYPHGERKIILEAKSSISVPSLGALDFGGLKQHMKDEDAQGCLLLAPSYPGGGRGEYAQAAKRADTNGVSCWTVEQLARVVAALTTRDITARHVLDIVLTKFMPEDVASAVDALLADTYNSPRELAVAMLAALRRLEDTVPADRVRSLDMLVAVVGIESGLKPSEAEARNALRQLVGASAGALTLINDDKILINTSVEELERRTANWAANSSSPRRASTFHEMPHRDTRPEVQ
jgi:hypothetical protein